MDFATITNLNAYVKGLKLQTTWELKQQSGDYTAKGRSLDEWLDNTQAQDQTIAGQGTDDHGDDKLRKIHAKLDAGGTLTLKERDYLKEKDPQAYQDLVDEERAQKAYEQALRRCRTQEEVDRLQMNHINKSLMVVRSVEHNSHIPLQKKLEIAMHEKRSVDDVTQSTREFIRKGEYGQLPTEAEEAAARREQEELLHPLEQTENTHKDHVEQQPEDAKSKDYSIKEESAPPQPQQTEQHTESENLRKVRRAHIKSAYHTPFQSEVFSAAPSQPVLDEKA